MNNTKTGKDSIAIIGSRGIPNRYGGFERFSEIISTELVKKGFAVYVSCEYSSENKIKEYNGVNLFYFPINPPKMPILRIVYEFLYDGYSLFWASRNAEIVYMLGYSAAALFFIPKIFGKKLLVNPDGMEWNRTKFSSIVKFLLKISEKLAVFWSDEIIADSKEIKKYLDKKYHIKSTYIAYGASEIQKVNWNSEKLPESLNKLNIMNYYLVIARLEPENNIDIIIEGYLKIKTRKPLIIVGNYADQKFEHKIKNIININLSEEKRIIFTGGIYDIEVLNMLRQNCKAYIHGHSVGGTNPSLLEAMISKNLIIAHDNIFNREVAGDTALYFKDSLDFKEKIKLIEKNYDEYIKFKKDSYCKVRENYSWDKIVNGYYYLFKSLEVK
jgi:rhamnosyltransferase